MEFGVHVSIAGGIDKSPKRAADLDCGTFQIFSTNPRGWKGREISDKEANNFKDKLKEYNFNKTVIHTSYLINIPSPKDELYNKSIKALRKGVRRADKLGVEYIVLHPGSHTGSGIEKGIKRIGEALKFILEEENPKVNILLENVAGAGTAIGSTVDELAQIIELANKDKRLGICYDTCHGFAAGYDIRDKKRLDCLLQEIDDKIGLDRLSVIHANDSKGELAFNKDRHHHIGKGNIGLEGFSNLVNHPSLSDKLFILETPIDEEGDDTYNLKTIKGLVK
ncbi:deoxyribonuclease IV [Halonatronum saccharophilum]|uniref:deoxyribonuclease IV n=1 Tax=Halonatronum saccharophilum TaxID=150060 RepID=UPI0004872AA3|nr:deoxyribonuclease IV [Halonatronum saccharophilum]